MTTPENILKRRPAFSSSRRADRFFAALLLMVACAYVVRAEHTRHWRVTTYDEFLKGTAHGVAVRSDGRLELAPKFTLMADADASYLWSLHTDAKGVLYAAGGSPAKVFRFDCPARQARHRF